MAELPDLNTDNVGYMAYWNAIGDGGASSIDPEEVLSEGNINSYDLYDNGVHITSYNSPNGRNVQARVKSDGWFVVWIDRTLELDTDVSTRLTGPWDIANNWYGDLYGSGSNFSSNNLERCINNLQSQLSNSTGINYNVGDVGLYDYETSGAATTGLSLPSVDGNSEDGTFSYTQDTSIKRALAVGRAHVSNDEVYARGNVEGEQLAYVTYSGTGYKTGSIDLLNRGILTDSGTQYSAHTEMDYKHSTWSWSDGYREAKIDIIVEWE